MPEIHIPEIPEGLASRTAASLLFEDLINKGFSIRVRVTGRSMTPFLRSGEVVTINEQRHDSLMIGDLIFFRNASGSLLLHRIVRKKRSVDGTFVFQTLGDGLYSPDEPIPQDAVLGKVSMIERATSGGETEQVSMETLPRRTMNYLLALFHLLKARSFFAMYRLLKGLPSETRA